VSRAVVMRAVRAFPLLLVFGVAPISHCQTNAAKGISGCNVTTEEYAVYSAVLSKLAKPEDKRKRRDKKNQFFLSDITATSFGAFENRPDHANWHSRSDSTDKPSKTTSESFNSKTHDSCRLKRSLELTFQYVLVPNEEIREVFKDGVTGWSKFYENYPQASGYLELSRVGFNGEDSEALVYVANHCGGRCGTGNFVLLRKQTGRWVVKNRVMLWIS
jgi:hypothetical protein